jgi:hypothetical protein
LNDPGKFKAPFIPKERIWQETEKLRAAYPAGRIVPVQVLELAEFDLGLELIPAESLREELEMDALLMGDLKSVLVDRRAFMKGARQSEFLPCGRNALVPRHFLRASESLGERPLPADNGADPRR